MDGVSQLADFGALGAVLTAMLGLTGLLVRDLIKQRDQSQQALAKLSESVDKLTDAHRATQEMIRTTNWLLQNIQHRAER